MQYKAPWLLTLWGGNVAQILLQGLPWQAAGIASSLVAVPAHSHVDAF